MMKKVPLSRAAAETILDTLKQAEKAQTPDGEFSFCPVCMTMSWLGHADKCNMALSIELLESALREEF